MLCIGEEDITHSFALGSLCQMLLAIVGNIRIREFYMIEIFWKLCLIDGKLLGEGSRVIAYSAHGECGSTGIDIVGIFSIVIYAVSQLAVCLVCELPSRRDRLRMIEEVNGVCIHIDVTLQLCRIDGELMIFRTDGIWENAFNQEVSLSGMHIVMIVHSHILLLRQGRGDFLLVDGIAGKGIVLDASEFVGRNIGVLDRGE